MTNDIKVGDILAGTWGYSMTIPCFYKVTKITPTGCKVIELDHRMVRSGDGGYNQMGWEMPVLDSVKPYAKEHIARYIPRWEEWQVGSKSDHSARYISKWDGREIWANYCD